MIINKMPTGQSMDIVNGELDAYHAANGEMSANAFVEFVYGIKKEYAQNDIDDGKERKYIRTVKIDENHIFVSFIMDYVLHAEVLSITNGKVTQGTITKLSECYCMNGVQYAAKLSDGRICIAHSDSNHKKVYLCICSINDYVITVDILDFCIAEGEDYNNVLRVFPLSGNRVFVSYHSCKYGVICKTTSANEVIVGTQIISRATQYDSIAICDIDENKLLQVSRWNEVIYLSVITINDLSFEISTHDAGIKTVDFVRDSLSVAKINKNKYALHTFSGGSYVSIIDFDIETNIPTIKNGWVRVTNFSSNSTADRGAIIYTCGVIFPLYASYNSGSNTFISTVVCILDGSTISKVTDRLSVSSGNGVFKDNFNAIGFENGFAVVYQSKKFNIKAVDSYPYNSVTLTKNKIEGLTATKANETEHGKLWKLRED